MRNQISSLLLLALLLLGASPLFDVSANSPQLPSSLSSVLSPTDYLDHELVQAINQGHYPDGYTGNLLLLSKSSDPIGDEYLPQMDLGASYLHFVKNVSPRTAQSLLLSDDVLRIRFDKLANFSTVPDDAVHLQDTGNVLTYQDVSNTYQTAQEFNISGHGVSIGITDSGTDFGLSDLSPAMQTLQNGYSAAFDPTGYGLAKTYLDLSPVTDAGVSVLPLAGKSVMVWGGENQQYFNSSELGITLQNLDVTHLSRPSLSNIYKVGVAYEPFLADSQYNQLFIFVLTDSTVSGQYDTLYVDLDTSLGLNLALNDVIFEQGETYRALVDWSLTDETPFGAFNPIIARDIDGDGVNDVSMGALGSTVDQFRVVGTGLIQGIDPSGDGMAIFYDSVGHGTQTAYSAAGRPNTQYSLYDNVQTKTVENASRYLIPGSAPDASIVATKGLTIQDFVTGWFWVIGLEPDFDSGEWVVNEEHRVDIVSNSWGDGSHAEEQHGLDLYSLLLDSFSTPNIFSTIGSSLGISYPNYPGVIFVVSIGNSGPGFGTVATPSAAALAFSVGASTNFLTIANQSHEGDIAMFSGEGPNALGMMKPDAVALGSYGFTGKTVAHGLGNGTYAAGAFGGTSEAGPRAAGILALIYEALGRVGIEATFGKIRTIAKSTARDLGFSSYAQGAGLLDAYAAVSAVLNGTHPILVDSYSSSLIGKRLNQAYSEVFGVSHPLLNNPVADSFVYVDKSSVTSSITLEYANGTSYPDVQYSTTQLIATSSGTGSFTTKSDPLAYNDLSTIISNYSSATLLHIMLSLTNASYEKLLLNGLQPPTMELYDLGQKATLINQVYSTGFSTELYSGYPAGDFKVSPGLKITDPGYENGIFFWNGLSYYVSYQVFQHINWDINITQSSSTYTINGSALAPEYQNGYFNLIDNSLTHRLPVVYLAIEDVQYGALADQVGEEDVGNVLYQLDQVYGAFNWFSQTARAEAGDHRYYTLRVPSNATYLAIQASWTQDGLIPDMYLYQENGLLITTSDVNYAGGGYYISKTSESHAQNLLIPSSGGTYLLEIHITKTPFVATPTYLNVTARYLTINPIDVPELSFSQNISQPITGDLRIASDNYSVAEFPELAITQTSIEVFQGSYDFYSADIQAEDLIPGEFSPEFSYTFVALQGEKVAVTVNWTTASHDPADYDVYVLPAAVDFDPRYDLLTGQGATPSYYNESSQFAATNTSAYIVYVDFIAGAVEPTTINIELESRFGPTITSTGSSLNFDTSIFANGEFGVFVRFTTNFGISFEQIIALSFNNYQKFTSSIESPVSDAQLTGDVTVKWSASRPVHAQVAVIQGGVTSILGNRIPTTSYAFDSTLFSNGNAYVQILLTDDVYVVIYLIPVVFNNAHPSSLPPVLSSSNESIPMQFSIVGLLFISKFIRKKKIKHQN